MKKAIFSLLFCLSTLLVLAGGNVKSSSVQGTVIDDEGNPVVGAKVSLLDSKQEVYTDFDGTFIFENVTTANQKVKVTYVSHEDLVTELQLTEAKQFEIKLQIQSK